MNQHRLNGSVPLRFRVRQIFDRVNPALVVSLAALSLSGFSFYRTFFYEDRTLQLRVLKVMASEPEPAPFAFPVRFAVTNTGNRDAAILSITPLVASEKKDGRWEYLDLTEILDSDVSLPTAFKPQEIRVIDFDFKDARSGSNVFRKLPSGESSCYVGLKIKSLTSNGEIYTRVFSIGQGIRKSKSETRAIFWNDSPIELLRNKIDSPSDWFESFVKGK
jgi:hypothetical protein